MKCFVKRLKRISPLDNSILKILGPPVFGEDCLKVVLLPEKVALQAIFPISYEINNDQWVQYTKIYDNNGIFVGTIYADKPEKMQLYIRNDNTTETTFKTVKLNALISYPLPQACYLLKQGYKYKVYRCRTLYDGPYRYEAHQMSFKYIQIKWGKTICFDGNEKKKIEAKLVWEYDMEDRSRTISGRIKIIEGVEFGIFNVILPHKNKQFSFHQLICNAHDRIIEKQEVKRSNYNLLHLGSYIEQPWRERRRESYLFFFIMLTK